MIETSKQAKDEIHESLRFIEKNISAIRHEIDKEYFHPAYIFEKMDKIQGTINRMSELTRMAYKLKNSGV